MESKCTELKASYTDNKCGFIHFAHWGLAKTEKENFIKECCASKQTWEMIYDLIGNESLDSFLISNENLLSNQLYKIIRKSKENTHTQIPTHFFFWIFLFYHRIPFHEPWYMVCVYVRHIVIIEVILTDEEKHRICYSNFQAFALVWMKLATVLTRKDIKII